MTSCSILSPIELALQPCGLRCSDIKNFLLTQSRCDDGEERELLNSILNCLYFQETTEDAQLEKGVIYSQKDIFTDDVIILDVLLHGDNNLKFLQLLSGSKNFVDDFQGPSCYFGRIELHYRTYNKCFCDSCIRDNRRDRNMAIYRVHVFKKFFIHIYQPYDDIPSLLQASIKALTSTFECCRINFARERILWLGDGLDPISSACKLSNRFPTLRGINSFQEQKDYKGTLTRSKQHERLSLTWAEIGRQQPYLIIDIIGNELFLFTRTGYNIVVRDFPREVQNYFDDSQDLCFLAKSWVSGFHTLCYNKDYRGIRGSSWCER